MRRKWVFPLTLLAFVAVAGAFCLWGWLNPLRSLASLRRVDGFPLYVMRYYGGYGFGDYLQQDLPDRADGLRQGLAPAWACTCFAALNPQGSLVFGRNFDWTTRAALLLFTDPPDGYASASMVDITYLGFGSGEPSWNDRQRLLRAPYLPFDGVNERGLAVGMMAVEAQPGHDPHKKTIGSLEAVRLVLDYARDVDEAVSLLQGYNIDFRDGPGLHYLLADVSGHSAVVEFVAGQMVVLRNQRPWQVSTNFSLSEVKPEGALAPCRRYNTVWSRLEVTQGRLSPSEAMDLLEEVAQTGGVSPTQWSVVYDMAGGRIRVVVGRQYERMHEFLLRMWR